jgi:deoxyribodipyrimidine photolyase-related protein
MPKKSTKTKAAKQHESVASGATRDDVASVHVDTSLVSDCAAIVYPHQLFHSSELLSNNSIVYLVEDPLFFTQYAFHRQKLMLHRASMKRFAHELETVQKITVRYVEASDMRKSGDIVNRLKKDRVKAIQVYDPEDDWLMRRLTQACQEHFIALRILPSLNFLTSKEVIESFVGAKKKLFFTQFYIEQRKRLGCLLDPDGTPVGGKWSFDTDNRKKLPKDLSLPTTTFAKVDSIAAESRTYVQTQFPNSLGVDRDLLYPTCRSDAIRWLEDFLENRLACFGDYEDAIDPNEAFLFHSCLTPMLNIGLISPQDIVDRALAYTDRVPLNSLEGFVRQVIGWREFVRTVYRTHGVRQRTTNYWNFERRIPKSFYDGSTGIEPVDVVIRRVLSLGYCHHIERLMILGNFMLLCEFDPDDVHRWFMELFVDAYDWVMVPNVYGMSQHADGGLMTTKPYISGSSYVLRMSSFKKGPWCEIWDALYWRFMHNHRSFFESNARMGVMVSQLDKMGSKLGKHLAVAEKFLEELTLLSEHHQLHPP